MTRTLPFSDCRAASKCAGNWFEPEPRYSPEQEDEIADLAAELYAAETEGDDWFLTMAERGALMRKCENEARRQYESTQEEGE